MRSEPARELIAKGGMSEAPFIVFSYRAGGSLVFAGDGAAAITYRARYFGRYRSEIPVLTADTRLQSGNSLGALAIGLALDILGESTRRAGSLEQAQYVSVGRRKGKQEAAAVFRRQEPLILAVCRRLGR